MRLQDFSYSLPDELIARKPAAVRSGSRLMMLDGDTGGVTHRQFTDILDVVESGDLMVFNDTRVIPARVFGKKASGGKLEILVERVVDEHNVLAHVRASKSPKAGSLLILQDGTQVQMVERVGAMFSLRFPDNSSAFEVLERIGHMPLPPYIDRADDDEDKERYQTVYAKNKGAVAAPTAGLHFDDALLNQLHQKGVNTAFVTLHVGAGTFQPVRVDDVKTHKMHTEVMHVSQEVCDAIVSTKKAGKRVIAVGTTSVRCLESASVQGGVKPFSGDTDIFIYPGFQYQTVDAMVTNFHLPESTLLMLVSAFAGFKNTMNAYETAVEKKYRFFSYGDAMFITPKANKTDDMPGE